MLKRFLEETVTIVEKKMGEGYNVSTEHVLKNNGVELDGILILKEGEHVSPSIYLNEYYEEYKHGKSMEAIACEVIDAYYQYINQKDRFVSELDLSFEKFKDKIYFRLVNFKQNKKLIKQVPHIPFLDLAILFYCLVEQKEGMIGSLHISNDLMKEWDIGKAELFRLAMENTPRLFPVCVRTMDEMVGGMLKKDMEELVSYYREKGASSKTAREVEKNCIEVLEHLKSCREKKIYVVTNTAGVNGAAVLLYENWIQNFSELKQTDFYILPSSIHEILLIPSGSGFYEEELKEMVREVNRNHVPEEDILSNEVYIYHKDGNYFEWEG